MAQNKEPHHALLNSRNILQPIAPTTMIVDHKMVLHDPVAITAATTDLAVHAHTTMALVLPVVAIRVNVPPVAAIKVDRVALVPLVVATTMVLVLAAIKADRVALVPLVVAIRVDRVALVPLVVATRVDRVALVLPVVAIKVDRVALVPLVVAIKVDRVALVLLIGAIPVDLVPSHPMLPQSRHDLSQSGIVAMIAIKSIPVPMIVTHAHKPAALHDQGPRTVVVLLVAAIKDRAIAVPVVQRVPVDVLAVVQVVVPPHVHRNAVQLQ
ncbi:hypothetical protein KDI_06090 [Dictyobacter arantiisoli]|uniref:Uncharacterized protein n=1 Tax=Dictyobacter arantiisoli TaxID=2014874 RepID=A0A5A5T717_9CHLR|nr:hypothetical protein KDI_06090 [Dictyobacter arantiisoli]